MEVKQHGRGFFLNGWTPESFSWMTTSNLPIRLVKGTWPLLRYRRLAYIQYGPNVIGECLSVCLSVEDLLFVFIGSERERERKDYFRQNESDLEEHLFWEAVSLYFRLLVLQVPLSLSECLFCSYKHRKIREINPTLNTYLSINLFHLIKQAKIRFFYNTVWKYSTDVLKS